jgi:hypothetical protein
MANNRFLAIQHVPQRVSLVSKQKPSSAHPHLMFSLDYAKTNCRRAKSAHPRLHEYGLLTQSNEEACL